jgi:Flp pilus assembly protein TadD
MWTVHHRTIFLGPVLVVLSLAGCGRQEAPSPTAVIAEVRDTGPTAEMVKASLIAKSLADFNRGAAMLEKYQYADAAEAFEAVVAANPTWTAARFNAGLALLNMQKDAPDALPRAEAHLRKVLETQPEHLPSHFCLGVYEAFRGNHEEAARHLKLVHEKDPNDAYAAYKYAEVLANLKRNDEAIAVLEKVVERDPGFISGVYRLGTLYNLTGQRDRGLPLLKRFAELRPKELAVGSFAVGDPYAAMGKYYTALMPDGLPVEPVPMVVSPRVLFSPDVRELGVALQPWSWPKGAVGVPGVAVGDLDRDGDQDLIVCGAGASGPAVLLKNDGKGAFADAVTVCDDAANSPCLGDVDNDGDLDLWLGRAGVDQLLLNDGTGAFTAAPSPSPEGDASTGPSLTTCARLIDLDSDGDLDLISSRIAAGSTPPDSNATPAPTLVLNNNLDGTFNNVAATLGLDLPSAAVAAFLADDFDNDRDIDIIAFDAIKTPIAWENFRVGRHQLRDARQTGLDLEHALSATSGDPFKTGRRDLLVFSGDRARFYRNQGPWTFATDPGFDAIYGRMGGTCGQFVDIDNDGDLDILIADAHRENGERGPELLINRWPRMDFIRASVVDRGSLLASIKLDGDAVAVSADFNGDGTCDVLLLENGHPPRLIDNVTRGGRWLAIDLEGKRTQDQTSLSSVSAIGARVELRAGTVMQQMVVGTPSGATAMPPLRIHAGLGDQTVVEWLRVLWPDSILQAELDVKGNQVLALPEVCRRTASCPHLFAWDGRQFAFISDFGGVGGLGYLTAPDAYAPPDPTEYVVLPGLKPRERDGGDFVLQVVEPLEELVYFDEAKLIAVDHPAGTRVVPNEMAAVSSPQPAFELFCFDQATHAVRATDATGRDVTDALARTDRVYAGATEPDRRFMGHARDHAIELDFGDAFASQDESARWVLMLDGWVEYSTSTSNYAASQAGLRLKAPTISVEREGAWVELFREAGYPAGINHVMTLDLAGKLRPGDRKFRVASNMDLSWDQISVVPVRKAPDLRLTEMAPRAADLHYLGFPREFSPDGRKPNLLDYSNIDRSQSWLRIPGDYTRYGDVTELTKEADDQFVIFGAGDEMTLRFSSKTLGPIPPGFERTFLFKADSYCKDADLYTGASDGVGPLPFHGMSTYPYGSDEAYPDSPAHQRYRATYNTRVIER